MYKQIVNPATGRKVNVNGKIGKQVLQQYKEQLGGVGNFPGMSAEIGSGIRGMASSVTSRMPTGMPGMPTEMPRMPTGMPGMPGMPRLRQAGVMAGINADVYKIVKEQIEQTCRELIQWPSRQNQTNFKPAYFLNDQLVGKVNKECGRKLGDQHDKWSQSFWNKLIIKLEGNSSLENTIGRGKKNIYDYVLKNFEIYHLNASRSTMSDDGTRGSGVYGRGCNIKRAGMYDIIDNNGMNASNFVFPYLAFPINKNDAVDLIKSNPAKYAEVEHKINILKSTRLDKLKYVLNKYSADEIIQEYNEKNNADDKLKVLKNWYNNLTDAINAVNKQLKEQARTDAPAQQSMSPTGPSRSYKASTMDTSHVTGVANLLSLMNTGGGKRRNAKKTSKKRNASKKRRNTSKNNNRR